MQITEFGGPEVLNVVDLPDPVPDCEQLFDVATAEGARSGPAPAGEDELGPRGQALDRNAVPNWTRCAASGRDGAGPARRPVASEAP
ncbi:hypothetical protein SAMN05660991_00278 [Trujillonella endophytica]|uniref:Uncharacterized protein n=1 Tax=Trujillonella endophytica TaxID=673521 RepID=A0A1H8PMU1_9ACTN|nr:hypothetical protein SAMN05660991_00278 [Trujillella endophytica]